MSKDKQYVNCECLNLEHLDAGRAMWEGEIEDETLFTKTDTMTVTVMNEGKVAMCTCGWCSYVNTVDLVNEQITINCDGEQTVLGSVNKDKDAAIKTDLSRVFINFLNTGILEAKYELGGLNVTFCEDTTERSGKDAYTFFYTERTFSEWKAAILPDGRTVLTRNNGLFYEFKMEGHSYTNRDLYRNTGVILMDIKIDDHTLYVCFDMAKMISNHLGLNIGYEPEPVIVEKPVLKGRMTKAYLNNKYDILYAKGQAILDEHSPCGKDGCHYNLGYCCYGCDHLGKNGCKVKALWCKLWLCGHAMDCAPKANLLLNELSKEAEDLNLLHARASKSYCIKTAYKKREVK